MVAALAGAGLSACDVTNVQPQNAIPENDVYSNAGRVALAVTCVYKAAQSGFYAPLNGGGLAVRGYPFGAAASSLDDTRGEDVVDMAGNWAKAIEESNKLISSARARAHAPGGLPRRCQRAQRKRVLGGEQRRR